MINQSKDGSISFFFENKLIASVPLNENNTYEDWKNIGNQIILDGMKNGEKFRFIKTALWKCIHKMKAYDNKMNYADHVFVAQAMFGLIKLNQIDPDGDREGIFIQPLRRPVNH